LLITAVIEETLAVFLRVPSPRSKMSSPPTPGASASEPDHRAIQLPRRMNLAITLLAFIVALGVLIVFHEFGHYLIARLFGVKVLRFSIGFGKSLWRVRSGRDRTEWVIAALPLGGYVKCSTNARGRSRLKRCTGHSIARASGGASRSSLGPGGEFSARRRVLLGLFVGGVQEAKPVVAPRIPEPSRTRAGLKRARRS